MPPWGKGCCRCQRPPASFRRPLAMTTSRSRRAESSAPLPGKAFVCNDISLHEQRQYCRREVVEGARLIMFLISSVPWPFATTIEPRYLNLSTSSRHSPSSKTACLGHRHPLCLRGVNAPADQQSLYPDGQHTLAFYIKYVPPMGQVDDKHIMTNIKRPNIHVRSDNIQRCLYFTLYLYLRRHSPGAG